MGTNTEYKEAWDKQRRESWQFQDQMAELSRRNSGGGGGGAGGCFPSSAQVLTPSGPKPIGDVDAGDMIVSYDRNGATRLRRVIRRREFQRGRLWRVTRAGEGQDILVTRRHSFLTHRGWVQAGHLRAGDELRTGTTDARRVLSVAMTDVSVPVFNLVTEGEHTFIVDGCVVHNYTWFRGLRTWLSQRLEWLRSARTMRALRTVRVRPPIASS